MARDPRDKPEDDNTPYLLYTPESQIPNPDPHMHLFVEHLTVIDCAYLCEQHGLVGESWITDIALIGTLDENSMVMDFAHVKKSIKRAIDAWVDHALLVPTSSPHLTLPLTQPSPLEGARANSSLSLTEGEGRGEGEASTRVSEHITFTFTPPTIHHPPLTHTLTHTSPAQALCLIDTPRITPEAVRDYLQTRLMEIMPPTVERVEVTLRTEPTDAPYYHYVHGLKKHDGNCQRIAHGHRSRLRISSDGTHNETLTTAWATRLNYAYIGTREDIITTDATHTTFAYLAPQGAYELRYPTALCHLIDSDSTVECIAAHIATECKKENPHDTITVRAYEGVMKGAVASA